AFFFSFFGLSGFSGFGGGCCLSCSWLFALGSSWFAVGALARTLTPEIKIAALKSPSPATGESQRGQRVSTRYGFFSNMVILRNKSEGFPETPVAATGMVVPCEIPKRY